MLQKWNIVSVCFPLTGELNLVHCIVCCACRNENITEISVCAAFFVLHFFLLVCIRATWLLNKQLSSSTYLKEKFCFFFGFG